MFKPPVPTLKTHDQQHSIYPLQSSRELCCTLKKKKNVVKRVWNHHTAASDSFAWLDLGGFLFSKHEWARFGLQSWLHSQTAGCTGCRQRVPIVKLLEWDITPQLSSHIPSHGEGKKGSCILPAHKFSEVSSCWLCSSLQQLPTYKNTLQNHSSWSSDLNISQRSWVTSRTAQIYLDVHRASPVSFPEEATNMTVPEE